MKKWLSKIFSKFSRRKQPSAASGPYRGPAVPVSATVHQEPGSDGVSFTGLVLYDLNGQPFVDFGDLTLVPGDRLVLSGPAGCGKSAALAAMRDAWLLGGSGDIFVPPEVRFVPQDDYFPDRTLRGVICSPDPAEKFTDAQIKQAFIDAGLEDFLDEIDDETKRGEYWKNTLSGGQKNKVSFAGAFLHAADIKVMIVDEITAALDAKSEEKLYPDLLKRMAHGIVISVAHHDTILPLHNILGKVADGKVTYTKAAAPAPKTSESAKPAP